MSDFIIRVERLGKKYGIRHQSGRFQYVALRDVIARTLWRTGSGIVDRIRGITVAEGPPRVEDFWALRDVSFAVKAGEAIGIIGRNGAGKSTLLKLLSRITEPTEGRIHIRGGIASLLEVGTGFHPELTGRENIFLNGAILGMTRSDIRRKFDDIVEFAGVERFLDTPVKRYSSGMYVRLAFAVAAHLDPEILIVDEVLAVGDAEFQRKCVGKMEEVARGGRTILFVSHNMGAVQTLCSSALLLDAGRVIERGEVNKVIATYVGQGQARTFMATPIAKNLMVDELSASPTVVESGAATRIRLRMTAEEHITYDELSLFIYSAATGARLSMIDLRAYLPPRAISGAIVATVDIHAVPLVEGDYDLGLWMRSSLAIGDFLNLGRMTVTARQRDTAIAPYAVHHRGAVELDYSARLETNSLVLQD